LHQPAPNHITMNQEMTLRTRLTVLTPGGFEQLKYEKNDTGATLNNCSTEITFDQLAYYSATSRNNRLLALKSVMMELCGDSDSGENLSFLYIWIQKKI
jgi:hypothetical protein